jgi:hypothetical protein
MSTAKCNVELKFFSHGQPSFPIGPHNWISKSDHRTYSSFIPNVKKTFGADAIIQPYGNGAFALKPLPHGEIPRGIGSVDLQTVDFGATFGAHSVAAGRGNATYGDASAGLGTGNMTVSSNTVAAGFQSLSIGPGSAAFSHSAVLGTTFSVGEGSFVNGQNQKGFIFSGGPGSQAGGSVGDGLSGDGATSGMIYTMGNGADAFGMADNNGAVAAGGIGSIARGYAVGGDIVTGEAAAAFGYSDYKELLVAADRNAVVGRDILNNASYSLTAGQHGKTQTNVYELSTTPVNQIQTDASVQLANGADSGDNANGIGFLAGAMGYGLTPVSGTTAAFANTAGYGYSEYFEWVNATFENTGVGKFVQVVNGKILPAIATANVIGVAVPKNGDNGFVSNAKDLYWQGALELDPIGRINTQISTSQAAQQTLRRYNVVITDDIITLLHTLTPMLFIEAMLIYPLTVQVFELYGVVKLAPITDLDRNNLIDDLEELLPVRKATTNPAYDPTVPYVSRWSRPEWAIVRLVGQVRVYQDGTVQLGDKVDCNAQGLATKGSTWFVTAVTPDVVTIIFR